MMNAQMKMTADPESETAVIARRSYLMVDYGTSACQATLYDVVEGRYRLVGRGEGLNTVGAPWLDLGYGLTQAIGQISEATGRKLLTLQGDLIRPMRGDGSGVDYFGATVSFGDPLRVLVAGLLEGASVASARKALRSVYAHEVGCLNLDDGLGRPGQIESILVQQPDVVFVVGGTDGGADRLLRELLETIAMAVELQSEHVRPLVVFGGNAMLRSHVADTFSELTDVHFINNVRSTYETEDIGHAIVLLAQLYYTQKVENLVRSGVLVDWSNTTPMNSAHAFGGIAEYLATAGQSRVLGVDVGSGQITLVSAVSGQVDLVVRSDKGLGRPLRNQLTALQNGDLSSGGAGGGPEGPLADYILDKSARPGLIPLTSQAADFELDLASRQVAQTVSEAAIDWSWPADGLAPRFQTLLLRGRVFSNAASGADALLALLDGLKAWGVFRVVLDGYGLLPAMGLLAGEDPEMVAQLLSGDDLDNWAWVVSPKGRASQGETILTARIQARSGQIVEVEIPFGGSEIVSLPGGGKFKVALKPASGIDVGAGPGQIRKVTLSDSAIGLVIDGRDKQPGSQGD